MKTEVGTIQSSRIGKNVDGQNDVLLHNTQLTQDDDVQTVEQMQMPGIQYNPPVGSKGFVGYVSSLWKFFKGIFDLVGRVSLNPGEIIIYSSSGGSIAASIRWNGDGSINLTAPGDFNITANINITGNTAQTGTIDATGNISSEADMIADSAVTAISALNHPHIGNLNYNTGVPVPVGGGIAPPATPPEFDQGDNTIDMGGQDIKNALGITATVGTHTHSGVTSGPNNTGTPN